MVLGKVKTFLGFLAVGIGGSFMTSRIQAQEDQTQP